MRIPRKSITGILVALMIVAPIYSCSDGSSPTGPSASEADIVLTGSDTEVTRQLVDQYDKLANLAQNPGQSISIAVGGPNDAPVIIRLSFNPDGKPILTRPDGTQALLDTGFDDFKPVIRLTEIGSRKPIAQQVIEPGALSAKLARGQQFNPANWAQAGMGIFGAAILAWLGIKVVSLTAVGLGYLALAAIVVGAVVIGGGVLTNVFKTLGWSTDDFISLFRQSFSDLEFFISGAIEKFQETYQLGLSNTSTIKFQETYQLGLSNTSTIRISS